MTRTLARDLSNKVDEVVTIQGWLHKKRLMGGLNFITVRDRSGLVQTLVEKKEELDSLQLEDVASEIRASIPAEIQSADEKTLSKICMYRFFDVYLCIKRKITTQQQKL